MLFVFGVALLLVLFDICFVKLECKGCVNLTGLAGSWLLFAVVACGDFCIVHTHTTPPTCIFCWNRQHNARHTTYHVFSRFGLFV